MEPKLSAESSSESSHSEEWDRSPAVSRLRCLGISAIFGGVCAILSLLLPEFLGAVLPEGAAHQSTWALRAFDSMHRPLTFTLAGKSVYFLVIDRFARAGEGDDYPACTGVSPKFCGGNLRGIVERLDYIQGMGFDCIWITPPVKQYASSSCHEVGGETWCSDGFTGYWASDFFQIDPHFGSAGDLKALSDGLHARKMCLVLDVVTNHAGIIESDSDARRIKPFNRMEYYNQIAGPGSFGLVQGLNGSWRPPPPEVTNCGPHNRDNIYCASWCGPGSYVCPEYRQDYVEAGWFGTLGDLNQSHPFVKRKLIEYVTGMVRNYSVDAIRLDTAAFMGKDFLADLQKAAGVQIIGEVTTMNMTHQASYQRDPPLRAAKTEGSRSILAGTLNFPLFYYVTGAFCGWITFVGNVGNPDMTNLTMVMDSQLSSNLYSDLDLLGNFFDNHDEEARMAYACMNDTLRMRNALAWVMLTRGIPMIYYGTEQGFSSRKIHGVWQGDSAIRESLWQSGYNTTTWQYQFIKRLNRVRGQHRLGAGSQFLHFGPSIRRDVLVFSRSSEDGDPDAAWVFLNNYPEAEADMPRTYCPGPSPDTAPGAVWVEVLSGDGPAVLEGGCYRAPNSQPKVLVQLREHGIIDV
mmetsp:Transcript_56790/g.157203  ORF Transcript_56790/g.157203 Transcript_56790/m.157203 type:complete len:632 (+) Transcript_56790:58-1953(+)